ncbi:hypothetical protein GF342_05075 [Candidatus Woesearchaeota archaeon]|nr:hypothetical protein [Candidatus Woesearchaeota archaeon]
MIIPGCRWIGTPQLPAGVDNLPSEYAINCADILRPIMGSVAYEGSTCKDPDFYPARKGFSPSTEYAELYFDQGLPGPLVSSFCAGWQCIPDVETILETHPSMREDIREMFTSQQCPADKECVHGYCVDPFEYSCPNHYAPCYCAPPAEPECEISDVEVYFQPYQKVWVNDQETGSNLYSRVTDTINNIGVPMVVNRETQLKGVYQTDPSDRDTIVIRGKSTFPDTGSVPVTFELQQGYDTKTFTAGTQKLPFLQLNGTNGKKNRCLAEAKNWEIRISSAISPPTFTFTKPGNYEISVNSEINGEHTVLGKIIGKAQQVKGWEYVLVRPLQLKDRSEAQTLTARMDAGGVAAGLRTALPQEFPYVDGAQMVAWNSNEYYMQHIAEDDDFPELAQKLGQEVLRSNKLYGSRGYDRIILVVPGWELLQLDFTDEFGEELLLPLNRKVVMMAPRGDITDRYNALKLLLETTGPTYREWHWNPALITEECDHSLNEDTGNKEYRQPTAQEIETYTKEGLAPPQTITTILRSPAILGKSTVGNDIREISQCAWVHMINYWKTKQDPEVLLVGGTITKDGKGSLLPLYVRDGFIDLNESQGEWQIVLRDESGNEIGRYGFSERFDIGGVSLEEIDFNYFVPWHDDTAQVDLEGPRGLVDTVTFSKNAPEVELAIDDYSIVEAIDDVVHLEWEGNDPDGDELVYTVMYSADFGEPHIVRLELEKTSYDLPIDRNATDHSITILANDGAHEAVSSKTFTVQEVEKSTSLLVWLVLFVVLVVTILIADHFIHRKKPIL